MEQKLTLRTHPRFLLNCSCEGWTMSEFFMNKWQVFVVKLKNCKTSTAKQQQSTIIPGHSSTAAIKQKLCEKKLWFPQIHFEMSCKWYRQGKRNGRERRGWVEEKTSCADFATINSQNDQLEIRTSTAANLQQERCLLKGKSN